MDGRTAYTHISKFLYSLHLKASSFLVISFSDYIQDKLQSFMYSTFDPLRNFLGIPCISTHCHLQCPHPQMVGFTFLKFQCMHGLSWNLYIRLMPFYLVRNNDVRRIPSVYMECNFNHIANWRRHAAIHIPVPSTMMSFEVIIVWMLSVEDV